MEYIIKKIMKRKIITKIVIPKISYGSLSVLGLIYVEYLKKQDWIDITKHRRRDFLKELEENKLILWKANKIKLTELGIIVWNLFIDQAMSEFNLKI